VAPWLQLASAGKEAEWITRRTSSRTLAINCAINSGKTSRQATSLARATATAERRTKDVNQGGQQGNREQGNRQQGDQSQQQRDRDAVKGGQKI
jgi:hypothetical protein